jgi:hypothetical protein
VPKVDFSRTNLPNLEKLTNAMLTSDEFESAMNEAAGNLGKSFDEDCIPDEVFVESTKQLDIQRRFGECSVKTSPKEFIALISEAMCLNIVNHKEDSAFNNNALILLACVTVVREVSHIIQKLCFQLRETPAVFKEDLIVNDLGAFVERKLFAKLKLGMNGLKLFTIRNGWLDPNADYQDAVLGKDEIRDCRLTSSYINELVQSGEWRAPQAEDIELDVDFDGKYAVGKEDIEDTIEERMPRGFCAHEKQPRIKT